MKYKRVLTVMGCSCLCLGPLSMASQVFTQTEDIPEIQNKTSGSAEEVPTLSTLPSTEVTESVDSSSASTSSGVADNTTEKPKESKNEEKLPQETPPTQLESVKTANNISPIDKNTKSITSRAATTVGDWDIQNGKVVAYHGSSTDLVIPAIKDPTTSKICSVELYNLSFSGPVSRSQITSIRFEPDVVVENAQCSGFTNLETFDGLNASFNVQTMASMFYNLRKLTSVKGINVGTSVTNTSFMFRGCNSLIEVNLEGGTQVTKMKGMFYDDSRLTALDLSSFDTSKVIDMSYMFNNASGLTTLNLSNFDTSQVTSMRCMFSGVSGLTTLNLSNFDTSKVTDMAYMFYNSSGLTALDLSNFDTSQVIGMSYMFCGLENLKTLNLSHWNTSNVIDMSAMFRETPELKELDLRSFSWKSNVYISSIFFAWPGMEEKKVLAQPDSPLETYNFRGNRVVPLMAVRLDSGEGTFRDGTHKKAIRYASVLNASIDKLETYDNPLRQGYDFVGWSKDTTQTPQVWTAQYQLIQATLPNSDQIGEGNTTNNNLETTQPSIAYQPKYFTGSGKIISSKDTLLFGSNAGLFDLSVTNSQGGNPASIAHIGVKDTTNQHNSWELKASFTSTMPTASFVFLNPKVNENKNGNIEALQNNSSGYLPVYLTNVNYSKNQTSIRLFPGRETTIMRTNGGPQNGIYDFSAKVGLIIQDNSQVAAGDYSGNVHWNLANVPI